MSKKLYLLLVLVISICIFPFKSSASIDTSSYNTLTFQEALAEEGISEDFTNYKETDDQITIYMFRGKGCTYCKKFLTFMNSITEEYGKYFKIVTFEVWNDTDNASLMNSVSAFLGQAAEGVPYVIIGEQVFPGYSSNYDDSIKKAITDLYNTKKEDRYDVMKEFDASKIQNTAVTTDDTATTGTTNNYSNTSTSSYTSKIVIWNLVFILIATTIIIFYNNQKFEELNNKISKLDNK